MHGPSISVPFQSVAIQLCQSYVDGARMLLTICCVRSATHIFFGVGLDLSACVLPLVTSTL